MPDNQEILESLEKLKRRVPDAPENSNDLLGDLLNDARDDILAFTNRTELPPILESTRIQLAAIYYTRMGMEGETSHSEGGVSRSVDALPGDIKSRLIPFRIVRTW